MTPPHKPVPPPRKPPPPPPPIDFTIVTYLWVEDGGKELLFQNTSSFRGTLAGAKASLAKEVFYTAKVYEKTRLVATVQGTQPKAHPVSVS